MEVTRECVQSVRNVPRHESDVSQTQKLAREMFFTFVVNREKRGYLLVTSGASVHMLNKSDLISEEKGTIRKSEEPPLIMTASEMSDTSEEDWLYFNDLDMFSFVQLLEDSPAVLSRGKVCEEGGCSL